MSQVSAGKSAMVQGRIVWTCGELFKGRIKTEFGTKTPKRNPQGEVLMEFGFGLAVPKSQLADPVAGAVWAAMYEEAFTLFPNRVIPPSFAMKYKDGDGIDDQGIPFNQREGYAGCIVLSCTTSLPIKFFRYENGNNILVNDGIKCGDYVNVQLQIKAHPAMGQGKAGLYLNPNAVQFLGYGKEIINAPSGDQIFGTTTPSMPSGASAIPLAPQGAAPLVPTGYPPAYPQQPMAPTMPVAPAYQQPAAAPQPHYGVVPPVHQPPPGGMPMAPAMPQPPMGNGYPAQPAAPMMPPTFAQPNGNHVAAPGYAQPVYPSNPQQPMAPPQYPPVMPNQPTYPL